MSNQSITPAGSRPPDQPLDWGWLLRTLARWLLVLLATYSVGWLLWRTGITLTPFVIGLVLAYLLLPIIKRLDRHMPRWASILTVYLVGLIAIELALSFVVPPAARQIDQFISNIPDWFERSNRFITQQIAEFQANVPQAVQEQINQIIARVRATAQENATMYAQRAGAFLLNSIVGIFSTIAFLLGFLVIPFFLFYVLLDTQRLPGVIDRALHPNIRADFWNIWHIIDEIFGRYIRGQLLLGLIISVMSFIGLTILNWLGFEVSYILLLAIIAGIGELIPVVGPILSAIPAIIVAIGGGWSSVLAVIVLYIIIQQLENQILVPRIVGNTLRLHPAILMVLLVIAASVGGLLLVILSAPLAAIARDVFIYLHRRLRVPPQPPELAIAGLLDQAPAPPPRRLKLPTAVALKSRPRSGPPRR
ncbi:AI-2E family transporter [Kallotenue papyrolyticum]|uniref:AI-2E family transporter n=1 Tax=Kallotenue papyrolyticum TaxID=1325125 RepID=UPI0004786307|nr:AI-2E family transporter [Kallotenue papyrolyticum]